MSKHTNATPTDTTADALTPSRRTFLKATGLAAAIPIASNTVGANRTPPTGAGRIEGLAAYLQDPTVFEENTEPAHATTAVPYRSVETAIDADRKFAPLEDRLGDSSYVRSLDGNWNFQFFERPSEMPASFDPESDDWDRATVPEPWQTQGYDQRIYANTQPTWVGYAGEEVTGSLEPDDEGLVDIPGVDDDAPNPSAVYNRSISVPSEWDGHEIFVHFEGVKQAYFVWVDDEYVGFHAGSMTPGEFDITDHVHSGGDHELTVQVYRWSDTEGMETIDMHRYSGIYRSVSLYATPKVHLRDFAVQQDLDDDYEDATLSIDAELANYTDGDQGKYTVDGTLRNDHGDEVTTLSTSNTVDTDGVALSMETDVSNPAKWSAEEPTLYTLTLEVRPDGADEPTEVFLEKVGFRAIEADRGHPGGTIRVNGELVNIRGTNRHETDPDTGRTVPVETMREDLELLKRFNLNAVRTSHYPNDPTFLRLADEYGIYLFDEACVETHWWEGILSLTTAYHDQSAAKFHRMVLRDRNHPSVVAWSTGNEAGTGAEHLEMAGIARGTDDEYFTNSTEPATLRDGEEVEEFTESIDAVAPDRLLYHQPNQSGWDIPFCDMLGPRYIGIDDLLDLGAGNQIEDSDRLPSVRFGEGERSVVMGEYNHAMGNSLGLVDRMWNEYIQPPVRRARDGAGDNDGVLVGSPEVIPGSDSGGAVSLDGTTDHIEVPESSDLDITTPGFTAQVTFSDLSDPAESPLLVRDGQYRLWINDDGEFAFAVYPDDGSDKDTDPQRMSAAIPDDLDLGSPHTLTGVCTDETLELFLDGRSLASTGHDVSTIRSVDEPVRVGSRGESEDEFGSFLHDVLVRVATNDKRYDDEFRSSLGGLLARTDYESEHSRGLRAAVERVAVFDTGLSADGLTDGHDGVPDSAVLWQDFGDLVRDKSLQGGFIWDWVNQDLNDRKTVDGEAVDYQFYDLDGPAGAFCLNGLVQSDRRPNPELWQLKQCHQPVKVAERDLSDGEIYVTNHHQFTNLSRLDASWTLHADDERLQSGSLDLVIEPNTTETVTLDDLTLPDPEPGVEYWLTVSVTLPAATDWADAGHEVAFAQFEVPLDAPEPEPVPVGGMDSLSVTENDETVSVAGERFTYTVDTSLGTFSSMELDGVELVERGPLLNFWRAPIMNELQNWGAHPASNWMDLGLDDIQYRVDSVAVDRANDSVVEVTVEGAAYGATEFDTGTGELPGAGFTTTYTYRVFGSGDVVIDVEAHPNDRLVDGVGEWLPKVGLQLEAPSTFDEFEWYGPGEQETYPDRKWGVPVGRYAGSVADQYVPYLPPSDNGNKAATRWAKLSDSTTDVGLFASSPETMNVNTNTFANLAAADYRYQLDDRGSVAFDLDHAVTGVGGTPVPPYEEYRVQPADTSFSVTLRPVRGDHDPMALHRRRLHD